MGACVTGSAPLRVAAKGWFYIMRIWLAATRSGALRERVIPFTRDPKAALRANVNSYRRDIRIAGRQLASFQACLFLGGPGNRRGVALDAKRDRRSQTLFIQFGELDDHG